MNTSTLSSIKRLICVVGTACIVVVSNQVFAAAGDAAPADLFTDAVVSADLRPSGTILRQHAVRINTGVLKGAMKPGALINFNLFPGTAYVGVVETIETRGENNFSIVGHLQGKQVSSFVLVGNNDVVVMNLRPGPEGMSQVRYLGDGFHVVRQVDENLFPPCANTAAHTIRSAPVQADGQPQGDPQPDAGNLIDVMVVYTANARIAVGGSNAMQALISLAFLESNEAYEESLVTPRVRLVHSAEVTYTESASFNTDLARLKTPGDGFLDEVQGWRNTYGADLVSLWIDNGSSCGLAYLMGTLSPTFEANGFSVVHHGCATGYYSFAHEMGHNQGCTHDRANAGGPGLNSYSYGWRFTGTDLVQYRTIMAYDPGLRIRRFSNPNVNYQGTPTGVGLGDPNEAYNALTLNNSAATVANFRQTVVTNDPPTFDSQPLSQTVIVGSNVTFSVVVDGTPPFTYEWRTNNIAIPGANDFYSLTISNVQLSDAGNYSVFVTNAYGTATSSNATLTVNLPSLIGEAVDAPTYTWFTGGNANWIGQAVTTHDGVDAGQSGPIGDLQTSWFETSVQFSGPMTLTFWWKVSSEANYDFLALKLNGVQQTAISGEVGWQSVAVTVPAGPQTLRWEFYKDFVDIDPVGQNRGWVDQISLTTPITYAEALDNGGLSWSSTGDQLWIPQGGTSHDGVDAAATGNITSASPGQISRMQTTVNGPSTLKFWWKVSSEANYDFLYCFLDGALQHTITGEQDWQQKSVIIPAGSHVVSWRYDKDDSDVPPFGQDKGWLDQVALTAPSRIVSNSYLGGELPQFSLQFTGVVGGSYTIQASSNLFNWVNLTNFVIIGSPMPFLEPGSPNINSRYYRVISP